MNVSAIAPSIESKPEPRALPGPAQGEAEIMKEFESVMLSMVLKQMRESSSEDGMFPGDNSGTLGGMFDTYMGEHLAESGGFGLMESFEGKLTSGPLSETPAQAVQQIREQAIGAYTDAISSSAE